MAKLVGELIVKYEGSDLRLYLTNRAIGTLQDEYGLDMLPIMPVGAGGVPNFGALARMIELALQRYHKDLANEDFADDLLTSDRSIPTRLLECTFPELKADKPAKKPKPPTTG